jgi:hypothetical protein
MRAPSLGTLSLVAGAAALFVSLGGPSAAVSVSRVIVADRAGDADAVGGISAARTPRPGVALALKGSRRFPSAVFPAPAAGPPGPRGPAGADGQVLPSAAGGALVGNFPAPTLAPRAVAAAQLAAGGLTAVDVASSLVDGAPGTATLRTLGTAPGQAVGGTDPRLADARAPLATAAAGGALGGHYPAPTIAPGSVTAAALGGDGRLWARIAADGTLLAGRGVVDVDLANLPAVADYLITFDRDVRGCVAIASNNDLLPALVVRPVRVSGPPLPAPTIEIAPADLAHPFTPAPRAMTVLMLC